jgi:hypothetical protein
VTKLELYGIAIVAAICACIGAYFYGRHDGTTIERARWESDALKTAQKDMGELKIAITNSNTISTQTLDAVKNIKVSNRTINNEVQREIKTDVRYVSDCFPDSGRLLWNAANVGVMPSSAAGSKPGTALPAANGAAGSQQSGGSVAPKPR